MESGMAVVSSEMLLLSCDGWEFMLVALAREMELILLQHDNHGSKMISIFLKVKLFAAILSWYSKTVLPCFRRAAV